MEKVAWILMLVSFCIGGMTGCSSSHQKNVSLGFGVYQAEYYDQVDRGGRN